MRIQEKEIPNDFRCPGLPVVLSVLSATRTHVELLVLSVKCEWCDLRDELKWRSTSSRSGRTWSLKRTALPRFWYEMKPYRTAQAISNDTAHRTMGSRTCLHRARTKETIRSSSNATFSRPARIANGFETSPG